MRVRVRMRVCVCDRERERERERELQSALASFIAFLPAYIFVCKFIVVLCPFPFVSYIVLWYLPVVSHIR